jgi:hypothetical protein
MSYLRQGHEISAEDGIRWARRAIPVEFPLAGIVGLRAELPIGKENRNDAEA